MIEPSTIARPYAEAVFRLADGEASLGTWSDVLAALSQIASDATISASIVNPAMSAGGAADLFTSILGDSLGPEAKNFVALLAENRRLPLLPEIARQFEALKAQRESVVDAEISTALPLSDEQLSDLRTVLQRRTGKEVRTSVVVDPELIGGVRVVIGDKVIDASVRAQLAQMAGALKA